MKMQICLQPEKSLGDSKKSCDYIVQRCKKNYIKEGIKIWAKLAKT